MRKSRSSEERIIGILKEHQAAIGAKELCREHGISDGTFYIYGRLSLASVSRHSLSVTGAYIYPVSPVDGRRWRA